jgi:ParB family transcriptional regulator, chromosome partitioning protein
VSNSNQKGNRFKGLMQVIRQESNLLSEVDDQPLKLTNFPNRYSIQQQDIIWIPLKSIHRDRVQARRHFDMSELNKMAASVQAVGIIDPLSVRLRPHTTDQYDLLAGEKRHRSAEIAGLELVPVRVFEVDDHTAEDIKTISNLQRSDLNKWEETNAILEMLCRNLNKSPSEVMSLLNQAANQKRGLTDNVVRSEEWETVEEVFTLVGRLTPESFRKHRAPLLKLPESIQTVLREGKLHYTKVNEILKIKDEVLQSNLLLEAINLNLSVDEIQNRVKELRKISSKSETASAAPSTEKRLFSVTKQIKSAKVWDNPKKKHLLEQLISQLETLLQD